jgi:hypothetical protein
VVGNEAGGEADALEPLVAAIHHCAADAADLVPSENK